MASLQQLSLPPLLLPPSQATSSSTTTAQPPPSQPKNDNSSNNLPLPSNDPSTYVRTVSVHRRLKSILTFSEHDQKFDLYRQEGFDVLDGTYKSWDAWHIPAALLHASVVDCLPVESIDMFLIILTKNGETSVVFLDARNAAFMAVSVISSSFSFSPLCADVDQHKRELIMCFTGSILVSFTIRPAYTNTSIQTKTGDMKKVIQTICRKQSKIQNLLASANEEVGEFQSHQIVHSDILGAALILSEQGDILCLESSGHEVLWTIRRASFLNHPVWLWIDKFGSDFCVLCHTPPSSSPTATADRRHRRHGSSTSGKDDPSYSLFRETLEYWRPPSDYMALQAGQFQRVQIPLVGVLTGLVLETLHADLDAVLMISTHNHRVQLFRRQDRSGGVSLEAELVMVAEVGASNGTTTTTSAAAMFRSPNLTSLLKGVGLDGGGARGGGGVSSKSGKAKKERKSKTQRGSGESAMNRAVLQYLAMIPPPASAGTTAEGGNRGGSSLERKASSAVGQDSTLRSRPAPSFPPRFAGRAALLSPPSCLSDCPALFTSSCHQNLYQVALHLPSAATYAYQKACLFVAASQEEARLMPRAAEPDSLHTFLLQDRLRSRPVDNVDYEGLGIGAGIFAGMSGAASLSVMGGSEMIGTEPIPGEAQLANFGGGADRGEDGIGVGGGPLSTDERMAAALRDAGRQIEPLTSARPTSQGNRPSSQGGRPSSQGGRPSSQGGGTPVSPPAAYGARRPFPALEGAGAGGGLAQGLALGLEPGLGQGPGLSSMLSPASGAYASAGTSMKGSSIDTASSGVSASASASASFVDAGIVLHDATIMPLEGVGVQVDRKGLLSSKSSVTVTMSQSEAGRFSTDLSDDDRSKLTGTDAPLTASLLFADRKM